MKVDKNICSGNLNLIDNKKINRILRKSIKYNYSQYTTPKGLEELRKEISKFLEKQNIIASYKNIFITNGSQQSINLIVDALNIKKILIEQPTYSGALKIFKNKNMDILGININENGIDLSCLEKIIVENKIKLIYVVPTFNNPTGFSWTKENRKQFLDIINKYDVIVIEDDPYSLLNFTEEKYESLYSLNNGKNIVYLGTFSKYISPALNVGFIVCNTDLINKIYNLKYSYDLCSPLFNQVFVLNYLKKYDLYKIIKKKIPIYLNYKNQMVEELKKKFNKIELTDSKGGIFILAKIENNNTIYDENSYFINTENNNYFRVNILYSSKSKNAK